MKMLLATALLLLTVLPSLPARAEAPPQGSFMLGGSIWPEALLPRYVMLTFEGEDLAVDLLSPRSLDQEGCEREGRCEVDVTAATAKARIGGGALVLEQVEIDKAAPIDLAAEQYAGAPAYQLYTTSLLGHLQQAGFEATAIGFTLDTGSSTLAFYRVTAEDARSIIVVPVMLGQSITRMAGCEVRALAPLLAKAAPTPGEARFRHVLDGFRTMLDYDFRARRASPLEGTPTEEETAAARKLAAAQRLPAMIAATVQTPGEAGVAEFRARIGVRMFGGDSEAFDAAVAAYGAALPDTVAFFRYVATVAGELTPEKVCADPSLGFMN